MVQVDCRIVAILTLVLTLIVLGGVIFKRHHTHHSSGAVHRPAEALVGKRVNRRFDETSTYSRDISFHLNEHCLDCICEVNNGCQPEEPCSNDSCGPLTITQRYWIGAGMPTLDDVTLHYDEDFTKAYLLCVNNVFCAKRTVSAFVRRHAIDCDRNGVIDCYDHVALHNLGPIECSHGKLSTRKEMRFNQCMKTILD